jgi:hypothetical protein
MPALIANVKSGQTYVVVHTQQNAAGEIRGTIAAVNTTTTLRVTPAAATTTTTGISATEFYAVAGLVVIFLIAAGSFIVRAKRPAS